MLDVPSDIWLKWISVQSREKTVNDNFIDLMLYDIKNKKNVTKIFLKFEKGLPSRQIIMWSNIFNTKPREITKTLKHFKKRYKYNTEEKGDTNG